MTEQTMTNNTHCDNCSKRIPKYIPHLICSLCTNVHCNKCNNLSINDALKIIENGQLSHWACQNCMVSIFPLHYSENQSFVCQNERTQQTVNQQIVCSACDKPCSVNKKQTCDWCMRQCHKSCIKNALGCIKCCTNIIPGFYYNTSELLTLMTIYTIHTITAHY